MQTFIERHQKPSVTRHATQEWELQATDINNKTNNDNRENTNIEEEEERQHNTHTLTSRVSHSAH